MSRRWDDAPWRRNVRSDFRPIGSHPKSGQRWQPYETARPQRSQEQYQWGKSVSSNAARSSWNDNNRQDDNVDETYANTEQFEDCKVLDDSDIHKTAGYIARVMRAGGPLVVYAGSVISLNQAMKALAVARSFLGDEELDFTVELSEQDHKSAKLIVSLAADNWARDLIAEVEVSGAEELYVSSDSYPAKVAGAIAKNVRAGRMQVCTAMGAKAILQACRSIALAGGFLENGPSDLCFAPDFGSTMDGATLLRLFLFGNFQTCKVGPTSDVHKTAGYIAAGARKGCPPLVIAAGAAGINQAIKSIALARNFLKDEDVDVSVQPDFPQYYENHETEIIKLNLATRADDSIERTFDDPRSKEMWVSVESKPTKVAGAISELVRRDQSSHVCSRGAQSVLNAMKAIFLTRKYLKATELRFAPEFGSTSDGGSLVAFCILMDSM